MATSTSWKRAPSIAVHLHTTPGAEYAEVEPHGVTVSVEAWRAALDVVTVGCTVSVTASAS